MLIVRRGLKTRNRFFFITLTFPPLVSVKDLSLTVEIVFWENKHFEINKLISPSFENLKWKPCSVDRQMTEITEFVPCFIHLDQCKMQQIWVLEQLIISEYLPPRSAPAFCSRHPRPSGRQGRGPPRSTIFVIALQK